jgi:hypothetical protein
MLQPLTARWSARKSERDLCHNATLWSEFLCRPSFCSGWSPARTLSSPE